MEKCYMCDALGSTREHAPPKSFFPSGYRKNLIVVPSCPAHNLDNSLDVEYVRNVVFQCHDTNEVALQHFTDKGIASYVHSPKLLTKTYQDSKPCILDGQETAIFPTDMERFDRVMEAITYALYYQDFGRTFNGQWQIWSTSLISVNGQNDPMMVSFRKLLHLSRITNQFVEKAVPQPKVFKYGFYPKNEDPPIYWLQFYEGFNVYALPSRSTRENP